MDLDGTPANPNILRADLALIGFGHVGRRFLTLLEDRRDHLLREFQLECRIVGIATASHGAVASLEGIDTRLATARRIAGQQLGSEATSIDVIRCLGRSNAALRVMVEATTLCITDGQPAIAYAEAALDCGCHVISANKGPVSFAYRRLSDLARRSQRSFLFEGAVMDGVPIFNLVREAMPAVTVTGFRGILNTTTQHILSAVEQGESFAEALARMQAEGIAESDPSLDTEGWDAAAKAAALANVLMDADMTPHAVEREAVTPATADAARTALKKGHKLRLVASAEGRDGNVRARVRLTEIAADALLATLPCSANALILSTDLLGEVAICQMGGDLTQTAYALFSDLATIARRRAASMLS
jgi:homoserine dehydrogenase